MEILNKIQRTLKAPKGQRNSFGNYNYRSCEDILEAVKPLLGEATLIITDEIVLIGDRYYVKATAILGYKDKEMVAVAYAREAVSKKGMDEAQITGAASSYARKYALNGLFCIDDTKDADTGKPVEYIDKQQKKQIEDSIMLLGIDRQMFFDFMNINSLDELQKSDFKKALAAIEAKRKQVGK